MPMNVLQFEKETEGSVTEASIWHKYALATVQLQLLFLILQHWRPEKVQKQQETGQNVTNSWKVATDRKNIL